MYKMKNSLIQKNIMCEKDELLARKVEYSTET